MVPLWVHASKLSTSRSMDAPSRTRTRGWSSETLDVLLHIPNLRNLTAFYISLDEWPFSKLTLLPNPSKLTSLTLNIVYDYPALLAFLRACPSQEYLAIDMLQDKNGETPEVIPPDVIPCLHGVYCDSNFLYFCVLAGGAASIWM